ncbi:GIY-YIG nuclease family protein [Bosea minatitlanensis]|uniref:GIY-YIG nuclease family protein n=1 Tax=Bosea minatitlanensis TaxID=128782 RepID=A0ABW0F0K8_9HYPH|nr:GIY-YIG nuclease family protein [Bosea minatitlanensis]MCT4492951.1 GIY-YIG nuclease family protein [Bosea minatitlanensis]
MPYFVYLLARKKDGTLYLRVTNDLARRVHEHKSKQNIGFTSRYDVDRLVWYEEFDRIYDAIDREKSVKKWRRAWKIKLIEDMNPEWTDLYEGLA